MKFYFAKKLKNYTNLKDVIYIYTGLVFDDKLDKNYIVVSKKYTWYIFIAYTIKDYYILSKIWFIIKIIEFVKYLFSRFWKDVWEVIEVLIGWVILPPLIILLVVYYYIVILVHWIQNNKESFPYDVLSWLYTRTAARSRFYRFMPYVVRRRVLKRILQKRKWLFFF